MTTHSPAAPLRRARGPFIQLALILLAGVLGLLVLAGTGSRDTDPAAPAIDTDPPTPPIAGADPALAPSSTVYLTDSIGEAADLEGRLALVLAGAGAEPASRAIVALAAGSATEEATAAQTIRQLELEIGEGRVRVVDLRRRLSALDIRSDLTGACFTDGRDTAC